MIFFLSQAHFSNSFWFSSSYSSMLQHSWSFNTKWKALCLIVPQWLVCNNAMSGTHTLWHSVPGCINQTKMNKATNSIHSVCDCLSTLMKLYYGNRIQGNLNGDYVIKKHIFKTNPTNQSVGLINNFNYSFWHT